MKNKLLPFNQKKIIFLTFYIFSIFTSWGQINENFNSGLSNSYTTGTVNLSSGNWQLVNVFQESSGNSRGNSGFAARINDDKSGSSLTTPEITTGIGEISFWYRELNNGGGIFQVQLSTDGTTFTDITTPQNFSGQVYQQFSYTLNNSSTSLYIRILSDDQPGHLIVDDVAITQPVNCSGAPTAQASNISFTPNSSTSVDINWNAATGGDSYILVLNEGTNASFTPLDGQDYSSDTGNNDFSLAVDQGSGNKVVYNGNSTSTTITGLTVGNDYYAQVFAFCSNASNDYIITTGNENDGSQQYAPSLTYCTVNGDTTFNTSITLVDFSDLNNSSGADPSGYHDFTSQTATVIKGTSEDLTVNLNTAGNYTVYSKAWIDWNNNGDFLDAGEEYDLGNANDVSNGSTNLSPLAINIPTSAITGNVRMRIGCRFDNYPTNPCSNIDDGEFEDYTIAVSDSSLDITTEIYEPSSQVTSSIVTAANTTTSSTAEDIFGFIIEDQASGDGLATNVTQMSFVPGPHNTADWTDLLQGITLIDENLNTYSPTVTISDHLITLDFSTPISIADGASLEFLLGIYLNTTNIVDGSIIQLEIPSSGHGFKANTNGSNIIDPLSLGSVTGNSFTIDIDATQLQFTQQPTTAIVNQNMSPAVSVSGVDTNGNIDYDYNLDITINSSGSLSGSPVTEAPINGVATFSTLNHNAIASGVTLTASDGLFTSITSNTFDITDAPSVPTPGVIFITEVSDASSSSNEYIEIYNNSSSAIDMTGAKLVMLTDGTIWDLGVSGGNQIGTATIPPRGFLIITRDGTQTAFENEFGVLNENIVFIQGSGGMYFGTGSKRRWQIYFGGTIGNADGTLIDDTETTVAGDNSKTYQNIYTGEFTDQSDSNANPGELDYLVFSNGTWVNNNAIDNLNDQDVLFYDNFTTSADVSTHNLYISSGSTFTTQHYLKIDGDEVEIDGDLVFASKSSTQIGTLGPLSASAVINGEVTIERIIPPKRAYRFISSSVNTTTSIKENWQEGVNNGDTSTNFNPNPGYGTHITGSPSGANGFDATVSGASSLFTFDNVNSNWNAVSNSNSNTLSAGTAYRLMVRGSRGIDVTDNSTSPDTTRLRMKGTITSPAINFVVPTAQLNPTNDNFNFIGNPYQATIDINKVLASSTNINTNQYYIWDPNKNSRGAYVTVDLPSGTNSDGSEANQYVQPNQAFFLRTTGNNPEVVFSQADKVNQSLTEVFKPSSQNDLQLTVQLFAQSNSTQSYLTDSFMVFYNNQFTNNVTGEDAGKLGNLDENIAIINNNQYLSIEKRALPIVGESIQFFNNNYRSGQYQFKIVVPNFEDVTPYLVDNYLQQKEELNNGSNMVSFVVDQSISASIDPNRFSIVFKKNSLNVETKESFFTIYPNPFNNEILINSTLLKGKKAYLKITSILGKEVYSKEVEFKNNEFRINNIQHLNSGIYILTLKNENNVITRKIIKE